MLTPYSLYMIRTEAPLRQEAILTRPFLQIIRTTAIEAPPPDPLGNQDPIVRHGGQTILDQGLIHTALNEAEADPDRALAALHAHAQKGLCKPDIALQARGRERIHLRTNQSRIITSSIQLFYEFRTAVFTAREQIDGLTSNLRRQASVSSNVASASPILGRLRARILLSISAAISGCSFRKVRALSLPCPIRSLP